MRVHPTPPELRVPGLLERYPIIRDLGNAEIDALLSRAIVATIDAEEHPVKPGDPCEVCWMVVEGELRVTNVSKSGRELALYSVLPGQMCALTTLCLFTGQPFPAHISASEETLVVGLPKTEFQRLVGEHESWRQFAFAASWERIDGLLTLLDDILMTDVPTRLASAMMTAQSDGDIHLTHSRLAAEIGSTREVVSRLLKRWENEGIVTRARGVVHIDDLDALRRLSQR